MEASFRFTDWEKRPSGDVIPFPDRRLAAPADKPDETQLRALEDLLQNQPTEFYENADDQFIKTKVGRRPLLTAAQETQLAKRMETGDPSARTALIESNLRLVVSIARRYQYHGVELIDLVQEGNVGLVMAAEKFDWRKGLKFSTYATWWIEQAVRRSVKKKSRAVKVPEHIHDRYKKIVQAEADFADRRGRQPSPEELAEQTGLTPDKINAARTAFIDVISLSTPVSEGETKQIGDFISETQAGPEEQVADNIYDEQRQAALAAALSRLGPRRRKVLELRFGMGTGLPLNLDGTAKQLGVSWQWTRDIQNSALRDLRSDEQLREFWQSGKSQPLPPAAELDKPPEKNATIIAEESQLDFGARKFSVTERAVMSLAIENGVQDKHEIAAKLELSANTVKEALSAIRKEFGQAGLKHTEKTIAALALAISAQVSPVEG